MEIGLVDENPITLQNTYPITDAEANLLTPYTFTIQNKCNTMVEYDVNLDIMKSQNAKGEDNRLRSEYIAIEFNGEEKKLLNTLEEVETSYPNNDYKAVEGRYLTSGELGANESISYSIKLWMDEHVEITDDAMNKNFISKVVITAKQIHGKRLADIAKLGDYVKMTPTSTSYTIPTSFTGYSSAQSINPSELNLWRVIKKNDDGTIEMISEYVSSNPVYLRGKTGYQNIVLTLQTIAEQYKNDDYTIATKHIGYYDGQTYQTSEPNYQICQNNANTSNPAYESKGCGEVRFRTEVSSIDNTLGTLIAKRVGSDSATDYWVSGRYFQATEAYKMMQTAINSSGGFYPNTESTCIWFYNSGSSLPCPNIQTFGHSVRPMVTLNSYVMSIGSGTSEDPYLLIG